MAKRQDPKQYAKEIEVVVQDALYNIAEKVGDAIEDAMGNVNDVSTATLKDIQTGFKDLAKIGKEVTKATIAATQGEFKRADAQKILLQRKAKERALTQAVEIARRNELENVEELEQELAKVASYNKDIEKSLDAQVKASNNINKAQGISGAALGALSKLTSKAGLGGLTDVFQEAKFASVTLANKLTDGGAKSIGFLGKSRVAAKGLGVALGGIAGYLAGPVGIAMLLGKVAKFLLEADKRAAATAQGLNMSKQAAADFNREIVRASANTGYLYTRIGEATELAVQFANNTGIIATNLGVFNADLGILNRRFGLSETQTSEIAKNMIVAGRSSTEFAVAALGAAEALEMQTGVNIQNQAIMKDIADLSAIQFLNLNRQPEALGRVVAQVRRLGLSFSVLEGTMGNLLNFEESISSELEAELLLGRQLNLQRAREAALNNDYAQVAAEIAKEMGSAAEFQKLNRIEQEALAKSLGMSREDLAKAFREQLALEKAGYASAAEREEQYQKYLKDGLSQKQALLKIGMKEFSVMKTNISFQEQLNNLLHNMKIIFMDSINPLLQRATKFLQDNPQYIDKQITKFKELVLSLSDFVTGLQDGTGLVEEMKINFEFMGDILNSQFVNPIKAVTSLLKGQAGEAFGYASRSGIFGVGRAYYDRQKSMDELEQKREAKSIQDVITENKEKREQFLKERGYTDATIKTLDANEETNLVLIEILEELRKGRDVYMDGENVSAAVARSNYNSW